MKATKQSQLIQKFLDNQLTSKEVAEIRKLMQKDAFFRESLLGYIENDAHPDDLLMLDENWQSKKHRTRNMIVATLSAAAMIAFALMFHHNWNQDTNYEPNIDQYATLDNQPNFPPIIISPDFDTILEDDEKSGNLLAHQSVEHNVVSNDIPNERINIEPLYRITSLSIDNKGNNKVLDKKWTENSNHLYGYLGDYKFVDYRIDKRRNQKSFTIPERHNEAAFHHEQVSESEEIPYMTFLSEALDKFDNEDYESALQDFRTILSQYPNDMNALFYAGLCHYHTDNNSQAIEIMARVKDAKINTFDQDAEWYTALAYKSINQMEETRILLTKISESNSYYGAMAHDELEKLNDIK